MEDYSDKLKKLVIASGFTQEKLASLLDVSFVTLNSWINRKTEPRDSAKEKIDLLLIDLLGADAIKNTSLKSKKLVAEKKFFLAEKLQKDQKTLKSLAVNLTYHSNATEGSTMTLDDVEAVIYEEKVLSNRTAIEQREAVNHKAALYFVIDEVSKKDFKFTPDFIKLVHLRLMNGIISNAGQVRNHGVRIQGSRVALANYLKIPDLLEEWCSMANSKTKDNIKLFAECHAKFEKIHPFSDGNGRTGRLLLFAMALSRNLVPPILKREKRVAYYKYLELAQMFEEFDGLEMFIADSIIETAKEIAKN